MKVRKTLSKNHPSLPEDVSQWVSDLKSLPEEQIPLYLNGLPSFLERPKTDLHHWIPVLDRFDDIMSSMVTKYALTLVQNSPYSDKDKALLMSIIHFEKTLFEKSFNRALYSSYDNLFLLLSSMDMDVVELILRLLALAVVQLSFVRTVAPFLSIALPLLEMFCTKWNFRVFFHASPAEVISQAHLPPLSVESYRFGFYVTKKPATPTSESISDGYKELMIPKAMSSSSFRESFMELVNTHQIAKELWVPFAFRLMLCWFMPQSKASVIQFLNIRFLALSLYAELSDKFDLLNKEPELASDMAFLVNVDCPSSPALKSAVFIAAASVFKRTHVHTMLANEFNFSTAHGAIPYILHEILGRINSHFSSSSYTEEEIDLYSNFFYFFEISWSFYQGPSTLHNAGFVPTLVRVLPILESNHLWLVNLCLLQLTLVLRSYPESLPMFFSCQGLPLLTRSIVENIDAILGPSEQARSSTYMLQTKLKYLLKLVMRLMQQAGASEGLRSLLETSLPAALKRILEAGTEVGASVYALSVLVMSRFIHNEPTSLSYLQEVGLPQAFLKTMTTSSIPPFSSVMSTLSHVFEAICLNTNGLSQFIESGVLDLLFGTVFFNSSYDKVLKQQETACELGTAFDELVRHYPTLKPIVIHNIIQLFDRLHSFANGFFTEETSPETQAYLARCRLNYCTLDSPVVILVPMEEFPTTTSPFLDSFENMTQFMEFFLHTKHHIRDLLAEGILNRLFTVYRLPVIPYDFAKGSVLKSYAQRVRLFVDMNPAPALDILFADFDSCMKRLNTFLVYNQSLSYFWPCVALISKSELAETEFSALIQIYALIDLMSVLFSPRAARNRNFATYFPLLNSEQGHVFLQSLNALYRTLLWEYFVFHASIPKSWLASKGDEDPDCYSRDQLVPDPQDPRIRNMKAFKYLLSKIPTAIISLISFFGDVLSPKRLLPESTSVIKSIVNMLSPLLISNLTWKRVIAAAVASEYLQAWFYYLSVVFGQLKLFLSWNYTLDSSNFGSTMTTASNTWSSPDRKHILVSFLSLGGAESLLSCIGELTERGLELITNQDVRAALTRIQPSKVLGVVPNFDKDEDNMAQLFVNCFYASLDFIDHFLDSPVPPNPTLISFSGGGGGGGSADDSTAMSNEQEHSFRARLMDGICFFWRSSLLSCCLPSKFIEKTIFIFHGLIEGIHSNPTPSTDEPALLDQLLSKCLEGIFEDLLIYNTTQFKENSDPHTVFVNTNATLRALAPLLMAINDYTTKEVVLMLLDPVRQYSFSELIDLKTSQSIALADRLHLVALLFYPDTGDRKKVYNQLKPYICTLLIPILDAFCSDLNTLERKSNHTSNWYYWSDRLSSLLLLVSEFLLFDQPVFHEQQQPSSGSDYQPIVGKEDKELVFRASLQLLSRVDSDQLISIAAYRLIAFLTRDVYFTQIIVNQPGCLQTILCSLLSLLPFNTHSNVLNTEHQRTLITTFLPLLEAEQRNPSMTCGMSLVLRHMVETPVLTELLFKRDLQERFIAKSNRSFELSTFVRQSDYLAMLDPDVFVSTVLPIVDLSSSSVSQLLLQKSKDTTSTSSPLQTDTLPHLSFRLSFGGTPGSSSVAREDTESVSTSMSTWAGCRYLIHECMSFFLRLNSAKSEPGSFSKDQIHFLQCFLLQNMSEHVISYPFLLDVYIDLWTSESSSSDNNNNNNTESQTTGVRDGNTLFRSFIASILKDSIPYDALIQRTKAMPTGNLSDRMNLQQSHWAGYFIVSLLQATVKPVSLSLKNVTVMDAFRDSLIFELLKMIKSLVSTTTTTATDVVGEGLAHQRCGALNAYSDLIVKILNSKLKSIEDGGSLIVKQQDIHLTLAKSLLEQNVLTILSNALNGIDLYHPASSEVISSIFKPLEILTKLAQKMQPPTSVLASEKASFMPFFYPIDSGRRHGRQRQRVPGSVHMDSSDAYYSEEPPFSEDDENHSNSSSSSYYDDEESFSDDVEMDEYPHSMDEGSSQDDTSMDDDDDDSDSDEHHPSGHDEIIIEDDENMLEDEEMDEVDEIQSGMSSEEESDHHHPHHHDNDNDDDMMHIRPHYHPLDVLDNREPTHSLDIRLDPYDSDEEESVLVTSISPFRHGHYRRSRHHPQGSTPREDGSGSSSTATVHQDWVASSVAAERTSMPLLSGDSESEDEWYDEETEGESGEDEGAYDDGPRPETAEDEAEMLAEAENDVAEEWTDGSRALPVWLRNPFGESRSFILRRGGGANNRRSESNRHYPQQDDSEDISDTDSSVIHSRSTQNRVRVLQSHVAGASPMSSFSEAIMNVANSLTNTNNASLSSRPDELIGIEWSEDATGSSSAFRNAFRIPADTTQLQNMSVSRTSDDRYVLHSSDSNPTSSNSSRSEANSSRYDLHIASLPPSLVMLASFMDAISSTTASSSSSSTNTEDTPNLANLSSVTSVLQVQLPSLMMPESLSGPDAPYVLLSSSYVTSAHVASTSLSPHPHYTFFRSVDVMNSLYGGGIEPPLRSTLNFTRRLPLTIGEDASDCFSLRFPGSPGMHTSNSSSVLASFRSEMQSFVDRYGVNLLVSVYSFFSQGDHHLITKTSTPTEVMDAYVDIFRQQITDWWSILAVRKLAVTSTNRRWLQEATFLYGSHHLTALATTTVLPRLQQALTIKTASLGGESSLEEANPNPNPNPDPEANPNPNSDLEANPNPTIERDVTDTPDDQMSVDQQEEEEEEDEEEELRTEQHMEASNDEEDTNEPPPVLYVTPEMDATVLEVLPDELRRDVLTQYFEERRRNNPGRLLLQISHEYLENVTNPEIKSLILEMETAEREAHEQHRRSSGMMMVSAEQQQQQQQGEPHIDADIAHFIASLDPSLRETVLMEQTEDVISMFPPSLLAEANRVRQRNRNFIFSGFPLPPSTEGDRPMEASPPQPGENNHRQNVIARITTDGTSSNLSQLLVRELSGAFDNLFGWQARSSSTRARGITRHPAHNRSAPLLDLGSPGSISNGGNRESNSTTSPIMLESAALVELSSLVSILRTLYHLPSLNRRLHFRCLQNMCQLSPKAMQEALFLILFLLNEEISDYTHLDLVLTSYLQGRIGLDGFGGGVPTTPVSSSNKKKDKTASSTDLNSKNASRTPFIRHSIPTTSKALAQRSLQLLDYLLKHVRSSVYFFIDPLSPDLSVFMKRLEKRDKRYRSFLNPTNGGVDSSIPHTPVSKLHPLSILMSDVTVPIAHDSGVDSSNTCTNNVKSPLVVLFSLLESSLFTQHSDNLQLLVHLLDHISLFPWYTLLSDDAKEESTLFPVEPPSSSPEQRVQVENAPSDSLPKPSSKRVYYFNLPFFLIQKIVHLGAAPYLNQKCFHHYLGILRALAYKGAEYLRAILSEAGILVRSVSVGCQQDLKTLVSMLEEVDRQRPMLPVSESGSSAVQEENTSSVVSGGLAIATTVISSQMIEGDDKLRKFIAKSLFGMSSFQSRLLRALKASEQTIFLPPRSLTTPSNASSALNAAAASAEPSQDTVTTDQVLERLSNGKLDRLYDESNFLELWDLIGSALELIGKDLDNLGHVASILLPSIESLFLVARYAHVTTTRHDDSLIQLPLSQDRPSTPLLLHPPPHSVSSTSFSSETRMISFMEEHRRVLNYLIRAQPSLLSKSFALLVTLCPKSLDFDNKRAYFRSQLHRKSSERNGHTGSLHLNVRRAHIFEDSYHQLTGRSGLDIKYGKLNVRFYEEEGIDAGGLTREWYSALARQMFNPDYALFRTSALDRITYQPNRASYINPDHLSYFKFIGRIIGKAIYDGRLLDCYFTRSFYKQLLSIPVDYKDMEAVDPSFYNSLVWILENDITDVLDLTFSTELDDFGVRKLVDLKPDGRHIPVTETNKHEYVTLVTDMKLSKAIQSQMEAFLKGFNEIIPPLSLSIFNEQELELLISGMPEIDMDEWRSYTEYHGGYNSSSPQIIWFWRAVRSFDSEQRAKLLQFVTGTSKVPLEGFSALQGSSGIQKFQIHKDFGNPDRLPTAHTCFNQLDLPLYENYESLRRNVLIAIKEGSLGFGFA